MDEPQGDGPVQPRETLIFSSSGEFRKEDYPWLVAVRAHVKGGDAGTADKPGADGYVILELFDQWPGDEEDV